MDTLVAFSFDDGREDNYTVAIPILREYRLPATFNITTGYVDESSLAQLKPSQKKAMSIENVVDIFNDSSFEIALHGNNHLNTIDDISLGRDKIIKWLHLSPDAKFGFASPGSGLNVVDNTQLLQEPFATGITYIRTSLRNSSLVQLRVLSRKIGRIIHLPLFYKIAYADTLLDRNNERILYSVPIMGDITVEQVTGLIRLAEKKSKSLIIMLHSIEDQPTDSWSWSTDNFRYLCKFLSEQRSKAQLDVVTTEKLYEAINCYM